MKGGEKMWGILNDKLDMLQTSNQVPEAIRSRRRPPMRWPSGYLSPAIGRTSVSLEKLGQLHGLAGDWNAAKPYFGQSPRENLEQADPIDRHALFRSARRLGFLYDNLGESDAALGHYETAFKTGADLEDVPYSDLGTILNNVALIYRKTGRQKAAEPNTSAR